MVDLLLPIVDASAPAIEALRLMREHSLSAVIAHANKRFWLYTASQVVMSLADDYSSRLADVESTVELHSQPKRKRLTRSLGLRRDSPGMAKLKEALSGSSLQPQGIMFAVDQNLIPLLEATPKDCYCRVDGKAVAGGTTGADCPDGHRGSVRCI